MLCLGAEVSAKGRHKGWGSISKALEAARQPKHKGGKETGKERRRGQASWAEGGECGDPGGETSPRGPGRAMVRRLNYIPYVV